MKAIFIIFAFTCYCNVQGQSSVCDSGWLYNNGHCYWSSYLAFEKGKPSQLADWFGGQLTCQSMHADLAYFNTSFEASFIQSLAGCRPTWLSLVASDVYSSNIADFKWVWWNNNEELSGYTVQEGNNTNCRDHIPSAAYLEDGQIIADYPDSLYPFVCVKRSNGRPSASNCQNGYLDDDSTCCNSSVMNSDIFFSKWFYFDGSCYLYSNLSVDYFAAQLTCQENNLHLPSVHNTVQNSVVGAVSMCQPMWIGLENIVPEAVCQQKGWAWEDFSHNDFTNNWFKPSIIPNEPQCNKSLEVAYIAPVESGPGGHGYYWYNVGSWERHTFSCVHVIPHSTQSASIVTTTSYHTTTASDSCSSVHPLKCPNGPVVCEVMGYTYECYCQPGYYLDTADNTCKTGNDLYASSLTFATLTYTSDLSDPGSALFMEYSRNITSTLNVIFANDYGYMGSTVTNFTSAEYGSGIVAAVVLDYASETSLAQINDTLNTYINANCTDNSCFSLQSSASAEGVSVTNLCEAGYVCPQHTQCELSNETYFCDCVNGYIPIDRYPVGNFTYETCMLPTTVTLPTSSQPPDTTQTQDSCNSPAPLKCPTGPNVCEQKGPTYECYCEPGYYYDAYYNGCYTADYLYALNLQFPYLTYMSDLSDPGSTLFNEYSFNITDTLSYILYNYNEYSGSSVTNFTFGPGSGIVADVILVYNVTAIIDQINQTLSSYIDNQCSKDSCFGLPSSAEVEDINSTDLCAAGYICPQHTRCVLSQLTGYACACTDGYIEVSSYQVDRVVYETCVLPTSANIESTSTPSTNTPWASYAAGRRNMRKKGALHKQAH